MKKVHDLEKKLNIHFNNTDLLQEAFTHRSYINENPSWHLPHNERLEFLGDAVLELAVTKHLFNTFPEKPEGELTSLRAALVNAKMLSNIGSELDFNSYLFLSRGEEKDTGRARMYILANTMEAIIGALYLDGGFEAAEKFIQQYVISKLSEVFNKKLYQDPKSMLQEQAQEHLSVTPNYRVEKEWGPDHDKHFVVGVYLGEEKVSEGEGPSKQMAQEEAARTALELKGWL